MADKSEQATQTHDFLPTPNNGSDKDFTSRPGSKEGDQFEDTELGPRATYINTGAAAHLSQEHRDYLIARHGTLELDPIPSSDPADPYNWPAWKKNANLVMVAFHSCMTTFIAAAIIPAYADIAADLNVSLQRTSYLTSLQIAILGGAPLFWKPLSNRYGRRPIWLISTLLAGVCNVGCAVSHDYASMAACRALVAFFISPAYIGSAVVTETFFKSERGGKMGIWTLLVTLGPPAGPFFMGFVAYHAGWRWILWILAIINFVQFVLYLFLGPETRYIRRGVEHRGSALKQEYLTFGRIDPNPFSFWEFIQPLGLFRYASILIPSVAYAIVFGFTSVVLTVEIPQLFLPKFEFNPQQLGLQFLGMIVGSIIGEQLGGRLSDFWMKRRSKSIHGKPAPEHRLWLSYSGFLLAIVGLIVFCVRLQQAPQGHWNVTPIIGVGIAGCGNQIITTVLVTYAIDCHPEQSASIGVFVNFVRSTWAFVGPFWYPDMFANVGIGASAGVMCGIIAAVSVIPVMILHFRGRQWRERKEGLEDDQRAVEAK